MPSFALIGPPGGGKSTVFELLAGVPASRKALAQNYRRAPHFEEIASWLEPYFLSTAYTHLSILNRTLIEAICGYLQISTKISNSWDYDLAPGKTERLVSLCEQAGGTEYVSGPAARDYIQPECFSERDIALSWFDYAGYPEYPQLWGAFTHGVTILDLLFNCGNDAPRFMKYVHP